MRHDVTILLVDDDPTYLYYLKDIIEAVGFNVITTEESLETLCLIQTHNPDLLIIDKVMQVDGLTIAEEVRKEFQYLPVLLISSTEVADDKRKALTIGCIDYLRKDIDAETFLNRIKEVSHFGHINKSFTSISNSLGSSISRLEEEMKIRKEDTEGNQS